MVFGTRCSKNIQVLNKYSIFDKIEENNIRKIISTEYNDGSCKTI
jgi:hypothetical protein